MLSRGFDRPAGSGRSVTGGSDRTGEGLWHLSRVVREHEMQSAIDQVSVVDVTTAPLLLTPDAVERMLKKRQELQLAKFRTTCTDCLPNF
jgi:hypothetical protein